MKKSIELCKKQEMSSYSVFIFEALHNPRLETYEFLKKHVMNNFSSIGFIIGGVERKITALLKICSQILSVCSLLMSSIEGNWKQQKNLYEHFWKGKALKGLHGIFTSSDLFGTLKEK